MHDFKTKYGPWALVAGASEGLGAAFSEALAKRGLNLVLIARRPDKLELLSNHLRKKYHIKVEYYPVDLADFQETKNYVSGLKTDIGLLVYNAAYAPIGYFENVSEETLNKTIDVNIRTPLLLSRLVSIKMIRKGKGGIVLMSSLAGLQGSPKIAAYAASKAFNTVFAEGIWHELKNHGIDVLVSCAGAIATPGYKKAKKAKKAPGTLEAAKVAEDTLNALGEGPTVIPGFVNKMAYFIIKRILPKKSAISIMWENTKHLS